MENAYDLLIIGAGPGGYEAAVKAAQLGMKVAVVEQRQIGGTCLNRGCIPTKTLMHAADLYQEARNFSAIGLRTSGLYYDISEMHRRKEEVLDKQRRGIEYLFKSNKIDYIAGRATIIGEHLVRISQKRPEEERQDISQQGTQMEIQTDKILIATGGKAFKPSLPGIDLPNVLTSDELLATTDRVYKRLVIIGGGVIGVEFAMLYNALDCEVIIIEAMDRLLPTMDLEISQNLTAVLKKRGAKIHTSANVTEIIAEAEKITEKELTCLFNAKGGKEESASADGVLVAIGRKPNTSGLLGEGMMLDMKKGALLTNNLFQTNIKNIYAIGDVIGGLSLAHAASAQGICAVEDMVGLKPSIDLSLIPGCVYTNPEIATVGLTMEEATLKGIKAYSCKYQTLANAKSVIDQQDRGFVKLIFEEETDRIIGAHLMCGRATDLISELTLAIATKTTRLQLASSIRPHPTYSEIITEAAKR